MQKVLICFTILGLSACAELSKLKISDDGTYRFNATPFEVWAPSECIMDIFVYDTESSVRFTTGRGYWMASGEYELAVFGTPDNVVDSESFREEATAAYFEIAEAQGFEIASEADIEINHRPAYQAVASANEEATVINTHILFPEHIVVTQLIYPKTDHRGESREIPWECYDRFVASIQYTGG